MAGGDQTTIHRARKEHGVGQRASARSAASLCAKHNHGRNGLGDSRGRVAWRVRVNALED